jgi:hypothetical protein
MENQRMPPPNVYLLEASMDGDLYHMDRALQLGADVNATDKARPRLPFFWGLTNCARAQPAGPKP